MPAKISTSLPAVAMLAADLRATGPDQSGKNFADMSIEELMNETVTSISKKETSLYESPATLIVIIPDDIGRFGIGNPPEAFRHGPLKLGVWGVNLMDHRHLEFTSQQSTTIAQIPRGVTGKITGRF